MQQVFGASVDQVVRQWRVGAIKPEMAMERIRSLLPLGDKEEYLNRVSDGVRAEVERGILSRRAADIVAGKELVW